MQGFRLLQRLIHKNAKKKGFWERRPNLAEKLSLVHSEVSEALEELRLPKFSRAKFAEELADIVIRVMDIAGHYKIELYDVLWTKHFRNVSRPRKHGKKF